MRGEGGERGEEVRACEGWQRKSHQYPVAGNGSEGRGGEKATTAGQWRREGVEEWMSGGGEDGGGEGREAEREWGEK